MGGPALLLDTYTGAAAAYSLRKLKSDYTGKVLQVRRASDHVEVDVGFDSNGLLSLDSPVTNVTEESTGITQGSSTNAAKLGEFCGEARRGGGDTSYATVDSMTEASHVEVITWYDQSGNANNATQVAADSQPRIYNRSSGLILQNGKPSLNAVAKSLVNPLGTISQPCTVMGIFSSSNVYNYLMGGSRNFFHNGNDTRFLDNRIDNGGTFPKNTQTAILGVGNGASSFGKVINSINQPQSVSFSSTNQINTSTFFARYPLNNGDNRASPQEFIAWNDVKSTSEIADIETNINTFYSIY
jgi:hypothetical protein